LSDQSLTAGRNDDWIANAGWLLGCPEDTAAAAAAVVVVVVVVVVDAAGLALSVRIETVGEGVVLADDVAVIALGDVDVAEFVDAAVAAVAVELYSISFAGYAPGAAAVEAEAGSNVHAGEYSEDAPGADP